MGRKLKARLLLAAAAAVIGGSVAHSSRAGASTVSQVDWILGASGNWNVASAWSGGVIPDNTSSVMYDISLHLAGNGPYTVTLPANSGSFNIDSLAINNADATLAVDSGTTLDLSQPDNNFSAGILSVSNGTFNLNGGTLANAILTVGSSGTFTFNSGEFQNVTLGSNLNDDTSYSTLYVENSLGNTVGLNTGTNTLNLSGTNTNIYFYSAYNTKFNLYTPDVFQGTINLTGSGAYAGSNSLWDLNGTINSLAANGNNAITDYYGLTINSGTINAGSAQVTGNTLTIQGNPFNNASTGIITVFNGDTLQFGGNNSNSGAESSNAGTIETTDAAQGLTSGGSATIDMYGNWSNTGIISASSGDTVNLGGNFTAADIGMASSGPQGTFNAAGAAVNLLGTLNLQGNTLSLNAGTGAWSFSGTIENGIVNVQNPIGTTYLNIAPYTTGTLQNVTLGSNFTVGNNGTLDINNTLTDFTGLLPNGYAVDLAGGNLAFNDAYDNNAGAYAPQSFNGTINITASGNVNASGPMTLAGAVNVAGGSGSGAYAIVYNNSESSMTNTGIMNVGSTTSTGNTLTVYGTPFINSSNGVIEVFNGNTLNFGSYDSYNGIAINAGTIETADAVSGHADGGSATINFSANWSNTGNIEAAGGDTVNLGGTFTAADVGLTGAAGEGTFTPNGATVNLTGTMNIGNGVAMIGTGSGVWNLTGTIANGTLLALNQASGASFLNIENGTLQDVTLGGNLTLSASNTTTNIQNTGTDPLGLDFNGYAVDVTGSNNTLNFEGQNNYFTSTSVPESINGNINLQANNDNIDATTDLGISTGATLTASAGSGTENSLQGGAITNNGTILASAASTLYIAPSTFINFGTVELRGSQAALSIGSYGDNWSNTGTIEADPNAVNAATETITLNGSFTPADVGLQSSGSGGLLTPNGATVHLDGTLNNTGNVLTFNSVTGIWNLGGTIENGTLVADNQADGASFLNINSGTLQNVTLGSNLTLSANNGYTDVTNTSSNLLGLNFNGYSVNITGVSDQFYYRNGYNSITGQYVADSINGNINLSGKDAAIVASNGGLNIDGGATITASSGGYNSIRGSGALTNSGTITATNNTSLTITNSSSYGGPLLFTNHGNIEASGGYLQLEPGSLNNSGTIAITGSQTALLLGNSNGNWVNTGTIEADTNPTNAATESINLGGTFNPASVGMANDGAANGVFLPNGATVNVTGTLVNSDTVSGHVTPNTLYFAGAGTSTTGHFTSNGTWNFEGTIVGGTVVAQDASGNQYLNIPGGSGTYGGYTGVLQNVTLGSNFSLSSGAGYATLQVDNTASNPAGLIMNNKTINLNGIHDTLDYVDATGSTGEDIGQTIDSGTINLRGEHAIIDTTGTLSIASGATINAVATAGYNSENFLSGETINNNGRINVGSSTAIGNQLFINSTNFTNESGGVVTVYTGNNLVLEATNWTNDGTIQTSAAGGLTSQAGASLTFLFSGTAVNNGTIDATTGDVVNFGSGTLTGPGTLNANGALQTGTDLVSGGTINVGSSSSSGEVLFINPNNFTNSGTINVFSGNTLVLGDTDPSTTIVNSGTLQTSRASGATAAGGATINLSGDWSNTGTISAGPGDTINLGGSFTSADVGLGGGGTQGTFNVNGANVNLYSNLVDSSQATFNLGGGALTIESDGGFTMNSGSTLENATINLAQGGGFSVGSGAAITFKNVALGNIAFPLTSGNHGAGTGILQANNLSLTIENTVQNAVGFSLGGLPLILQGNNDRLAFVDATSPTGQDIGQNIDALATIEGAGSTVTTNGTLTISGTFNMQVPDAANGQAGEDFISGNSVINAGNINVGSNAITNNSLIIDPTTFTNASTGVITVYNQNALDITAANWSNAGTIQTAAANGDIPSNGQGAILEFNGSWTNSGTIKLTHYDEVVFGSAPGSNSGTIGSAGQVVNAVNTGTLDVGSTHTTGLTTLISPNSFTNSSSGTIEVFNGNNLQLGDPYGYPTNWSNAGTIESATAANDQSGGGAQLQFSGNWSNTGRILAATGDTVNFNGSFNASDIGLESGGGTFTPNGANVEISGVMNLEGNSAAINSQITLSGTVADGTLSSGTDAQGNEYLIIGANTSATFQNIILGSNYTVAGNGTRLHVDNTVTNPTGLDLGGHTLTLSGQNTLLQLNDAVTSSGGDVPETLQNGTLTLSGIGANLNSEGNLTLAASLTLNSTSTGQDSGGGNINILEGNSITSGANINVGFDSNSSAAVSGNKLGIFASHFSNAGAITVYGGNDLFLGEPTNYGGNSNWVNSGTVQSNDHNGLSAYLEFSGTWLNNGSIIAGASDTIILAGSFNATSVGMANDGASNATFTTNGASVNLLGTMVNSDTVSGNVTPNTLYFAGAGTSTSGHITSNGAWNLGSGSYTGTIDGGTIYTQDSTGKQWLNIYNGTLENVTLGTNLTLNNTGALLQIQTATIGTNGLSLNGKSVNVTANNVSIHDKPSIDTLNHGIINLAGSYDALDASDSGLLILGSDLTINSTGAGINSIAGGSINSAGQISAGSASVTGDSLSINPGGFNNLAGGIITVFGGDSLQLSPSQGRFNNAGTITSNDGTNGGATLTFGGTWSNTGTISAAVGDTVNLGGTFNPASVAMANDGAANGVFLLNGATVNVTGTLVNSDTVNGNVTPNTLYFAGAGTSTAGHVTSNGTWNLGSSGSYGEITGTGTIQGGTIYAQDSTGTQYLNILNGEFQNVTLHSNLALNNANSTLTISNSGYTTANAATGTYDGLVVAGSGGYQIDVSGSDASLAFSDVTTTDGQTVPQTLANVVVNLSGTNASINGGSELIVARNAIINGLGGYSYQPGNISGTSLTNEGHINAGSTSAGGFLTVETTNFTNSGTMTAFNSSTLQIGASFGSSIWTNTGTITTGVASGAQTGTGSAVLTLAGTWSNTGTISAAAGDTVNLGGTFNPASVAMANDGATNQDFAPNGATVNVTGTLVNSDTVNGNVTPNTLYFAGAGTSTTGHVTSNGTWNLSSGTIQGGTIYAQDSTGTQFLNIGYEQTGSFQNVTLGSNFNLPNNYSSLEIINGAGSGQANGLITSGQAIDVSGFDAYLTFNDASNTVTGAYIGQTLSDVTINLSGADANVDAGENLSLASGAAIDGTESGAYNPNSISGLLLASSGSINAGSTTAGGYLVVDPTTFNNSKDGRMTVYNGSVLQIGNGNGSTTWANAGTITTGVAGGSQTSPGSATLTLLDNWSNTGTISAAAGDTINLGGTFSPASVGMANDGATNGIFAPGGAAVNITGTLINSDTVAGNVTPNTLYFAGAGTSTSGHATSNGTWTFTGTIIGGNLMAQDSSGTEYLTIAGGELEDVTLLSNLQIAGSNNTLNIDNSSSGPTGLDTNGHSIILSGTNFTLQYDDVLAVYPNYINQSLTDTLYLSGSGDNLSVSKGALKLSGNVYSDSSDGNNALNGSNMINSGTIDAGSNGHSSVSGNTLTIDPENFTNSGTISVFGGSTSANNLVIGNDNPVTSWSNLSGGTISTNDSSGGSAMLTFMGDWSNAGTISANSGDTINLGGTFHPADVGMADDGATNGVFMPNGATVYFTGTLINSDTGATTTNTLNFTATDPWNSNGGTIIGGTVTAEDGTAQYLNISSNQNVTFQNVALGSGFAVDNPGASLTIANSSNNAVGMISNGYNLTFAGNGSGLNIADYRNPETGVQTGQTFNDAINLSGPNAFINGPAGTIFTLATSGSINDTAANATNNITLTEFTNQGVINAGSSTVTGNITNLNSAVFSNTGTLHIFNRDTLNLYVDPNSSWTNSGTMVIAPGGVFTAQNNDGSPLNVILASGSTIDIQLGSTGESGQFSIPNGSLTIQPDVTLDLSLAPGATLSGPYTLFNFVGLSSGTFNTNFAGNFGTLAYNNGSIVLNGTPTPEPASLGLLAVGGGLLLLRRRRRNAAA